MKFTKLVHSCLLIETPERTALFDPGAMSEEEIDPDSLEHLDDIIITHEHFDHMSVDLIKKLVERFPEVRITAAEGAVSILAKQGIDASSNESSGISIFESPHEEVMPLFVKPTQIGVHYLGVFSHPGDSLHFEETKDVLALPVTAPWGATVDAVNLAIDLGPKYVIPVHDWFWKDAAAEMMYEGITQALKEHDITFLKPEIGKPMTIDI